MRRDYDADAQPNASGAQYNFKIKDAGKWTKVVVYYDMGQVVNAISSKKANANLEVSDTDLSLIHIYMLHRENCLKWDVLVIN